MGLGYGLHRERLTRGSFPPVAVPWGAATGRLLLVLQQRAEEEP